MDDESNDKVKVSYLLPRKLVRKIRLEAADREVWPATIIAERIEAPAPKTVRRNAG